MMTRTEILGKLQEIFVDLLEDDGLTLSEESSTKTIPEWDSLLHITLMATVEDEFKIPVSTDEIAQTKDVKTLVDIIERKLN